MLRAISEIGAADPSASKRPSGDIDAGKSNGTGHPEAIDREFAALLVSASGDLRRAARTFARNPADVDDLTQTVLFNAWRAQSQFVRGTNLSGWLYVILRDSVRSRQRREKREQGWDESFERLLVAQPGQEWACEMIDLGRALPHLPQQQYRALWAVVVEGQSLEDVSRAEHVSPQAIKSRINRARRGLDRLTSGQCANPARLESRHEERSSVVPTMTTQVAVDGHSEEDRHQIAILRLFLNQRRGRGSRLK